MREFVTYSLLPSKLHTHNNHQEKVEYLQNLPELIPTCSNNASAEEEHCCVSKCMVNDKGDMLQQFGAWTTTEYNCCLNMKCQHLTMQSLGCTPRRGSVGEHSSCICRETCQLYIPRQQ